MTTGDPILRARHLSKSYRLYGSPRDRIMESLWRGRRKLHHEFRALDDVSLDVDRGETVGVIGRKIGEKHHVYDGYEVILALYAATLVPGKPMRAKRVRDFRWVASSEFGQYQFPDADQRTMDQLLGIKK